jgi:hypothetical protein
MGKVIIAAKDGFWVVSFAFYSPWWRACEMAGPKNGALTEVR